MSDTQSAYYIPEPSRWPLVGSIALFIAFFGGAMMLNGSAFGTLILGIGIAAVIYMFAGWFAEVISESVSGKYNKQVDVSFRWGMTWFIFSEVMFFAAFFGALYYARVFSVPWLAGEGSKLLTHEILWPQFVSDWPMNVIPDVKAFASSLYDKVIPAWGIPALNTAILLSSGLTITFAHWALKKGNRRGLCWWLFITIALGVIFISLQASEYIHAYKDLNLRLDSGIYGSTFFMLTGFHGFHVTMGVTMLLIILLRSMRGHFTPDNHFGFEGVAWYWHFVDVVWLGLFIFVYWL